MGNALVKCVNCFPNEDSKEERNKVQRLKVAVFTTKARGHIIPLLPLLHYLYSQKSCEILWVCESEKHAPDIIHKWIRISEHDEMFGSEEPSLRMLKIAHLQLDMCINALIDNNIDLVIYDFFMILGALAAQVAGVPYIMSRSGQAEVCPPSGILQEKARNIFKNQEERIAIVNEIREKYDTEPFSWMAPLFKPVSSPHLNLFHIPKTWLHGSEPKPLQVVGAQFKSIAPLTREEEQFVEKLRRRAEDRGIIYVGLGPVVGKERIHGIDTREVCGKFVACAEDMPEYFFVITLGDSHSGLTPTTFAPQDNVLWATFVPQLELLKHATLFVSHCGSGSTHEALRIGTPVVGLPFFGDQIFNASKIEDLGCGKFVNTKTFTKDTLILKIEETLAIPNLEENLERERKEEMAGADNIPLVAHEIVFLGARYRLGNVGESSKTPRELSIAGASASVPLQDSLSADHLAEIEDAFDVDADKSTTGTEEFLLS